jgi:hypothetical protein
MRVLVAIAILSLGCSSSSTNNSTDETGGTGGNDAATGGTGGKDSGQSGGSAGSGDDSGLPDAAAGQGGRRPCMTTPLVINEISTHGFTDEDEYLELYNPGSSPLALDQFTLDYGAADGTNVGPLWSGYPSDTIPPMGFYLIGGSEFSGASNASLIANVTLEDIGGVRLRGDTGAVDAVTWGDVIPGHNYSEANPAPAPGLGASIGRTPDGVDCDDNSFDFQALTRSPGESNSF